MGTLRIRHVEIVAQDPSVRRNGRIVMARVSIPWEDLEPGPMGYAVQVVDYDASSETMYQPVIIPPDEEIKAPPSGQIVGDPAYHAINAYALVMLTLRRFEFALGRRVAWGTRGHQLKVVPHAFEQANAFYSEDAEALLFGYVRTRPPILLGLSHDVVVHETTHALLDGLRDGFTEPSSPDQAALHEGLADIVALLSVYALPEVLRYLIDHIGGDQAARPRGGKVRTPDGLIEKKACTWDRLKDTVLFGLADEMRGGNDAARVNALRRSILIEPAPRILERAEFEEPHRRGEVLVSAVLRAFLDAWVDRIDDLGGPGADYVSRDRVAEEGATIADLLLTMAIRAIDYTPPIHIEFGDYLSALLTADREIRNDDTRYDLRRRLLDTFASFGIKPASDRPDGTWKAPTPKLMREGLHFGSLQVDETEMFRLVWSNRKALRLDPEAYTRIGSLRPAFRVSPDDGFQIHETVVECTQYLQISASQLALYGLTKPIDMDDDHQVEFRGGSTLILDEYGELKYEIYNPLPTRGRQDAAHRRRTQRRLDYLWNNGFMDRGASLTTGLAALHRRRAMGQGMDPSGADGTTGNARGEAWI